METVPLNGYRRITYMIRLGSGCTVETPALETIVAMASMEPLWDVRAIGQDDVVAIDCPMATSNDLIIAHNDHYSMVVNMLNYL